MSKPASSARSTPPVKQMVFQKAQRLSLGQRFNLAEETQNLDAMLRIANMKMGHALDEIKRLEQEKKEIEKLDTGGWVGSDDIAATNGHHAFVPGKFCQSFRSVGTQTEMGDPRGDVY